MKHKTSIQIRFKDIDKLGHVNNANHFTYFELARIQYFNDVVGRTIDWDKDGMILANARIDYKLPIYLHDQVVVYTSCTNIGTKSFELSYRMVRILKNEIEEVLATGATVLVCFDYSKNQTVAVPEEWKQKMNGYDHLS
jgi:acyl-CoA thioester hydrolase